MIRSFKCADTEALYHGKRTTRFAHIARVATRKPQMLDDAVDLKDLVAPHGNRLEALKGDRKGQWSIRINVHWRVCFVWTDTGPADVEIADYH
ncbi:MAG: type II toxin-antitoxin system RelE/ParE family toxin [Nitrospirae bacterium]|nr:type II toxin-antitoxin system RelE/ParE family toxin [Nitrospirota bacterium]